MIDRNCRIITRQDIVEWQESMNKCAECISKFSDLNIGDAKAIAALAATKKLIGNILHDMAFLVAYVDSTLAAEYGENVNSVAVEMQRILDKKCKGE